MEDRALAAAIFALLTAVANIYVAVFKRDEARIHNQTFTGLTNVLEAHIKSSDRLIRDYSARFQKSQEQVDKRFQKSQEQVDKLIEVIARK